MSAPTAKELLDEINKTDVVTIELMLAYRVNKVLALHAKDEDGDCAYCHDEDGLPIRWPCATRRALDGEEE